MADTMKIPDLSMLGWMSRHQFPSHVALSDDKRPHRTGTTDHASAIEMADAVQNADMVEDLQTPLIGRFNVLLDDSSGRVFTEIMDIETETVLQRIPPYFKTSEELESSGKSGVMI